MSKVKRNNFDHGFISLNELENNFKLFSEKKKVLENNDSDDDNYDNDEKKMTICLLQVQ